MAHRRVLGCGVETVPQPRHPPGARMRTIVRSTLLAGLTGSLMVSAAWAGIGLSPSPVPTALPPLPGAPAAATTGATAGDGTTATATTAALSGGQVLVGAAKNSMTP